MEVVALVSATLLGGGDIAMRLEQIRLVREKLSLQRVELEKDLINQKQKKHALIRESMEVRHRGEVESLESQLKIQGITWQLLQTEGNIELNKRDAMICKLAKKTK